MSTQLATTGTKAVSRFLNQENVLKKFSEILGDKAQGFISSVITAVNSNALLRNATQESIYTSALMAATLDLPINQNLGFAYIIPFNNRKENKQEAQFQIGYKGFIQLAMRSGQFKTISVSEIYKGQLVSSNPLTGFLFDFEAKESDEVIGYAAYFSLINGFEKTLYLTKDEVTKHGIQYSQTFKKGFGLWKDQFDAMAKKTVLKMLISKYAPFFIEMQKAQIADQGVIRDVDTMTVDYIDNDQETSALDVAENTESTRILDSISKVTTLEQLKSIATSVKTEEQRLAYKGKEEELKGVAESK